MQTEMKKALQVGRTTMLAAGLAVTLALVLGATTVALAAVPGDPLKLGQVNVINNATTALRGGAPDGGAMLDLRRGSGKGPVLNIENTNPASNSRGVNIQVAAGQTPITVNPDAGKASNLNADKLDGKSETDFLSASRIYRVGNTVPKEGPGSGGSVTITSFPSATDGLACDDGDVAIGAGGRSADFEDDLNSVVPASSNSYHVTFQDNDSKSNFFGFVLCSDSASPFKE
jgi:hypothetical protein